MRSLYRFGMIERILLAIWVLVTSSLIVLALSQSIEHPDEELAEMVRWWTNLVLPLVALLVSMPALRLLYRDHVEDRLPWQESSSSGGD